MSLRERLASSAAAALVVCLASPAWPQEGQISSLRIEVVGSAAERPGLVLALNRLAGDQRFYSEPLSQDRVARLSDVPYGRYNLTISDAMGRPEYDTLIDVGSQTRTIVLRLATTEIRPSPSGTVTISNLQSPVSKKALRAFEASRKFFDVGDYQRAADELEKALTISPRYAQALSSLGATHIGMGRYENAIGAITRAIEIGGPTAKDLSNIALAEYKLHRYSDAMVHARSALRFDSSYHPAHYVLGLVLAGNGSTMAESVLHLERASQSIESAKAVLKTVLSLLSRGNVERD